MDNFLASFTFGSHLFFWDYMLSCATGFSKEMDRASFSLLISGGLSVFPAEWAGRYREIGLGGLSEVLFVKCWVWGGRYM